MSGVNAYLHTDHMDAAFSKAEDLDLEHKDDISALAFGCWRTASTETWWLGEWWRRGTSRKRHPPTAPSSPAHKHTRASVRCSGSAPIWVDTKYFRYSPPGSLITGTSLLSKPWKWWRLKHATNNKSPSVGFIYFFALFSDASCLILTENSKDERVGEVSVQRQLHWVSSEF